MPVVYIAHVSSVVTTATKSFYREEVRDLAVWCQFIILSLNVIKTKEMIVDYRKRRTRPHSHRRGCGGAGWELQVPWWPHHQQTIMVQTHQVSREEDTTKPIPPLQTEKIWHGSWDPQKVIHLHHREHPDWLHHCLVWQLLDLRLQGTTEGNAYGPVHHWDQASCHPGPLYQAVSEEGPTNCQRLQPPLVIDCLSATAHQVVPEH